MVPALLFFLPLRATWGGFGQKWLTKTAVRYKLSCDICDFECDNGEELTTHEQTIHQKANTTSTESESTTTRWTGPKEPPPSWTCLDQHGKVHGPFSWDKMLRWYNSGGINPKNMLKRDGDDNFATFEEVQKIYGQQPFLLN